ncbi:MAG: primosomal protein N' [Gammaproteobacteria bacterium]|nr:primosomal protein N' [Gammaproteobacteria bacterium]
MPMSLPILRIALPGPFPEPLDYLLPADLPAPPIGARVEVPLGRRRVIGVVVQQVTQSAINPTRLRAIIRGLDDTPVLDPELLALIEWTARYYHHPIGECLATALPVRLRQGFPATPSAQRQWQITDQGKTTLPSSLAARAPRQAELLERLQATGRLSASELGSAGDSRGALQRLVARGDATLSEQADYGLILGQAEQPPPELNAEQKQAAEALINANDHRPLLLEGVTGSGKTEVYLTAIQPHLSAHQQVLVIVPEIGLTPQLLDRFRQRLKGNIAVLHSGLPEGERLNGWLAAQAGQADVIIGTRSAIFTPLPRPGLIIVDEEHDASLKQQDGLRYSARDLAVMRAHRLQIPIVLGSATPSLESIANARAERYQHYRLDQRAGAAKPPSLRLLDVRGADMQDGLSTALLDSIKTHLNAGNQVLLFLNRRGYAPVLICHDCGWIAECSACDARYTWHRGRNRLLCHHCDQDRPIPAVCPTCSSVDLRALGLGTERIEAALAAALPDSEPIRIDRDSTRRRGSFEQALARARQGDAQLLLGTQMLAKGHHLPNVTLVGIIDADQGLFGADFRSAERLAQLIIQVAGRAGREVNPGEVLIQTHHPEHPLLQTLIHGGYPAFADAALSEREITGLPPARALALLRAESAQSGDANAFLETAKALIANAPFIELVGPFPAPMERRANRYRMQLFIQADQRGQLQSLLERWLPDVARLSLARKVRWAIDVDPADTL